MKKILFIFLFTISFFLVDTVNAEDIYFNSDFRNIDLVKEAIGVESFNSIIADVLSEYEDKYSSDFPYYNISINGSYNISFDYNSNFQINLFYYDSIPTFKWQKTYLGADLSTLSFTPQDSSRYITRSYKIYSEGKFNDNFMDYVVYSRNITIPLTYNYLDTTKSVAYPYDYYISNYDLTFVPLSSVDGMPLFYWNDKNLYIPNYEYDSFSKLTPDNDTHLIKPYYLYDSDFNVELPNIVEVNLNDYAYVAIALKDYSIKPFQTLFQVQGQFCSTPVYENGQKPKDDIDGFKVTDICSVKYDVFTPYAFYVTQKDITNKAIYYIKANDKSFDNKVKIDTNIFDISYISEEDADNPYVNIGGKLYPTIPFDKLPSSSNQNTDEGFVPGESERIDFEDIFNSPLDAVKGLWNSISSVFDLINHFLSLLPDPLAIFLYVSFTLAIVLGIIKIIL